MVKEGLLLEEKIVRKIMTKYFQTKQIKVIPTRGAGPDFSYGGKAIEIKGSGVKGARFNLAISQYIKYAFKYSDLEIALPIDILNAENLIKLDLLCRIVWQVLTKNIKTYLVAEEEQQYFVKEFYDGKEVLSRVLSCIPEWPCFKHEIIQYTMEEMETNLTTVNMALEEALLKIIRSKPDITLAVSDL